MISLVQKAGVISLVCQMLIKPLFIARYYGGIVKHIRACHLAQAMVVERKLRGELVLKTIGRV